MNWKQVRLGDICESRLGKTMNASTDTGEARQYLCAVNVKWDEFDFSTLKNAPFSPDEIMKYTVQKGDLLICEGGDTGRAAIWDKDEPIQYQNALHRVRFKDGTALPRFCLHFLHYLKLCGILDKEYSHGATILHLVTRSLYSITMPLPSLCEQQRIVEVLDAEFAKIDALKANAEKNLQNAKDLFQSSLKKELEPKDGWRLVSLKEIGCTQTGTTPKTSQKEYYGDYLPFIKPADVNTDGLGGLNYQHEGLSKLGATFGRVFDPQSILMVCIGATIGKVGYSDRAVSSNQQINILTPKSDFDHRFIYYAMASPTFQFKIHKEGESAKATLPIINKSKWESLTIFVPDKHEQTLIATSLSVLSNKCKALQGNYTKTIALCDDLKQALLRKAFNGEL